MDAPERKAFTRADLDHAAEDLAERLHLDPRDRRLLKFTHNATYLFPHDGVVIRLVGSTAMYHRADKVVSVAHWLEDHDYPAVRLVAGLDQPVHHNGFVATIWRAVPPNGREPSAHDLGRLLRRFHALAPPSTPLPSWDPLGDVRRRLQHADGLDPGDVQLLADLSDELATQLHDLEPALPPGPIHGDAFLGNIIPGLDGPVLCDFDSTTTGPREWDFTPVAVGHLRFADPGAAHHGLADAYGFDVTAWPGFATLRRIRELQITTSVVPVLRTNPAIVDQFKVRLGSLRSGDETAVRTRY